MLEGLINKSILQLNQSADDWIDAINISMRPLVENGIVTQGYVDGAIENAINHGPYIVVTKHIALVHAEIEKGALKDGVGLTTLINPVSFGNKDNDPVKYLFCLSSVTKDKHLNILSDLSAILENKEFFELLDSTTSKQAVMDFIKNSH